jgi:hypothetical protein
MSIYLLATVHVAKQYCPRTVCNALKYLSSTLNNDESEKFCHKSLKNILMLRIVYIQIDF